MRNAELLTFVDSIDESDPIVYRKIRRRTYRWIALGYLYFYGPMLLGLTAGTTLMYLAITRVETWGVFPILLAACVMALSLIPVLPLLQRSQNQEKRFTIRLKEHPTLYDALRRVCRQLRVALPQQISLSDEFNASVRELPRRFPFLWRRRELALGVPLIQHLSAEQMESVLAHEMAHLSQGDDRASMSLYRIRLDWERRMNQWNRPPSNAFIGLARFWAARFTAWWWPRLNRDAFTLARSCERFADSAAAKFTTPKIARESLLRIGAISVMLDQCLTAEQTKRFLDSAEPTATTVTAISDLIDESFHSDRQSHWVRLATQRCRWHTQTHPSLSQRWTHLEGTTDQLLGHPYPGPCKNPTTRAWFGAAWDKLHAEYLNHLIAESRRSWSAAHRHCHQQQHEIARLIELGDAASYVSAASIVRQLYHADAALETLRSLPESERSPSTAMAIARYQAERVDPDCLAYLRQQFESNDPQQALSAGESLINYFYRAGEQEQIVAVVHRCDALDQAGFTLHRSRGAGLDTHQLSDEQLQRLRDWLRDFPEIQTVHLARRTDRDDGHVLQHVLSVRAKGSGPTSTTVNQDLLQKMLRQYKRPARMLLCTPGGSYSRLARRVLKRPEYKLDLTKNLESPATATTT